MAARISALAALTLFAGIATAQPTPDASKGWHRVVGILQYLEADYPMAVESKSDFELTEQRSFAKEASESMAALGPNAAAFAPRMQSIRDRVEQSADPAGVSADCAKLVEDLVMAGGLQRSPKHPPDLVQGAALYAQNCTACHGADGRADVEAARAMEPKPANFHNPELFEGLTPYKAFNTTSFGVTGTAMPAFAALDEKQRWNLAFFLFTMRQPTCDHEPRRVSLERLATSTDVELARDFGEAELSCLRRRIPSQDEEGALLVARSGVEEALRLSGTGDFGAARQSLLDAYLDGLEPVEPLLRSRDGALVAKLEERFMAARLAAENKSPTLQDEGRVLLTLIDQARRSDGQQGSSAVFWQAFLILLREGFEAMVVITALLAVLKKLGQTKDARVVHAGWISAVVVGALAFVFGQHLIAGARREWIEGVAALAAVFMLLYAAFWLNDRAQMRDFMGKIRGEMQDALGRGSVVGLFVVSFTAMLRESFETALFLQGLSIDAPTSAAMGAAAGVGALLLFALFVRQFGYRLPMKALFAVSTWMLFGTAVVLLGKGLHALQEVGVVPLKPLPLFSVEVLGIFPDAVSLIPQLALALFPLVLFGAKRLRAQRSSPETV